MYFKKKFDLKNSFETPMNFLGVALPTTHQANFYGQFLKKNIDKNK